MIPISLVPRPSYFAGVGKRRPGIHCSRMHEILTTMMSRSFLTNSTDVSVGNMVSTDGLNYTHCCIYIATYKASAA